MLTNTENNYLLSLLNQEREAILQDQKAGCNVSNELNTITNIINKLNQ